MTKTRHSHAKRTKRVVVSLVAALALSSQILSANAGANSLLASGYEAFRAGSLQQADARFAKAAESGDATAQWLYGRLLRDGRLGRTDKAGATKWLQQAAEQGHISAQADLGVLLLQSPGDPSADAIDWLNQAARRGNSHARLELARLYETGRGVERDMDKSRRWYHQAAEQGQIEAMHRLGVMNYEGLGVARNPVQAASWLRQAAERGHADAQLRIGAMRENGEGVRADKSKALNWYRQAAEQGLAWAQYRLAVMLESGSASRADPVQAYAWFLRARAGASQDTGPWDIPQRLSELRASLSPDEIAEASVMAQQR